MEIKGMKGLHEICKEKGMGISMPDQTSVGNDVKLVLSINSSVTKEMLREFINKINQDKKDSSLFDEAKIILSKELQ